MFSQILVVSLIRNMTNITISRLRKNSLSQNKRRSAIIIAKKVHRLIPSRGLILTNVNEKSIFMKYSIFAESYGSITKNQLETIRRLIKRNTNVKNMQFIIRTKPFVVITKKPLQVRMGGGKGSRIGSIHFNVIPGQCSVEFETLSYKLALKLFTLVSNKLCINISWSNNYVHSQTVSH